MTEPTDARVAVYIDFDNIVISRYDQINKRGQFHKDEVRSFDPRANPGADVGRKLEASTVDLGAILDFASSFGTIAVSRAYADWSVPVNSSYRRQLIERAVDLVQLFPTVASMKNGADIRLAIDVIEDLYRLSDLTHVVIVAGDSDYIALAQRCKQLGRYVVGIGVAGATSKALAAACDEFADYDALPNVPQRPERIPARGRGDSVAAVAPPAAPRVVEAASEPAEEPGADPAAPVKSKTGRRAKSPQQKPPSLADTAADLLVRALHLAQAKDDNEWQPSGVIKNQMLRMDPTFQERALGFASFSDFVKSLGDVVEFDTEHPSRRIRVKPTA